MTPMDDADLLVDLAERLHATTPISTSVADAWRVGRRRTARRRAAVAGLAAGVVAFTVIPAAAGRLPGLLGPEDAPAQTAAHHDAGAVSPLHCKGASTLGITDYLADGKPAARTPKIAVRRFIAPRHLPEVRLERVPGEGKPRVLLLDTSGRPVELFTVMRWTAGTWIVEMNETCG